MFQFEICICVCKCATLPKKCAVLYQKNISCAKTSTGDQLIAVSEKACPQHSRGFRVDRADM